MYRGIVAIFAVLTVFFSSLQFSNPASALDGYRLCAMRKGVCKCQKAGDAPGVLRIMKKNICSSQSAPQKVPVIALVPLSSSKKTKSVKTAKSARTPALNRNMLIKVQKKLYELGYDVGASKDRVDPITKDSIISFQRAVGTPADGTVTKKLLSKLNEMTSDEVSEPVYANNPPPASSAVFDKKPVATPAAKRLQPAPKPLPVIKTLAKLKPALPRVEKPAPLAVKKTPVLKNLLKKKAVAVKKSKPVVPKALPSMVKSAALAPPAAKKTSTGSNPLSGLFGNFSANKGLPNSMDGYKNCALRKGSCLCQKLTNDPGVWTTMETGVCTRRTAAVPQAPQALEQLSRTAAKPAKKSAPKIRPVVIKKAKPEPVVPKTVPTMVKSAAVAPSAPKKTATSSNPLSGLFGNFSANKGLPTSMKGYKNCAQRKGKCLCQKLTNDPGVWTTMETRVCTRRAAGVPQTTSALAQLPRAAAKPAKKTVSKIRPVAIKKAKLKPVVNKAVPTIVKSAALVPSAPQKTVTGSNPLAGLFGNFSANKGLPTSMEGYRNCAPRKGKCLCQKLTNNPGVWTTMAPSVCAAKTSQTGQGVPSPSFLNSMDNALGSKSGPVQKP